MGGFPAKTNFSPRSARRYIENQNQKMICGNTYRLLKHAKQTLAIMLFMCDNERVLRLSK
jgi:hypothetical protein